MGAFNWDKNEPTDYSAGGNAGPYASTGSKPMASLLTGEKFVTVRDAYGIERTVNKEWWDGLTDDERRERGYAGG